MNSHLISSYSDQEKLDIMNQYLDFLLRDDCDDPDLYDYFRSLVLNKRLKYWFIKATVPACYDSLNYDLLFWWLKHEVQDQCEKIWFDFPTFFMMSCVAGAIACFEEHLSVKKILSRWSWILLNTI